MDNPTPTTRLRQVTIQRIKPRSAILLIAPMACIVSLILLGLALACGGGVFGILLALLGPAAVAATFWARLRYANAHQGLAIDLELQDKEPDEVIPTSLAVDTPEKDEAVAALQETVATLQEQIASLQTTLDELTALPTPPEGPEWFETPYPDPDVELSRPGEKDIINVLKDRRTPAKRR